jgi:hypothetical protein
MTERSTDNPDIIDLLPRLNDLDAGVRRIALIELADLEDPDGLPWLTDALLVDANAEVRAEAARCSKPGRSRKWCRACAPHWPTPPSRCAWRPPRA